MDETSELVSLADAAKALGVPEVLLRNRITTGRLRVRGTLPALPGFGRTKRKLKAVLLEEARAAVAPAGPPQRTSVKRAKAPPKGVFDDPPEVMCPIGAMVASRALLTDADRVELARRRDRRAIARGKDLVGS